MLKIALTGGIASGKTLVSQMFAALGATIIDTDEIAKAVVKPKQSAYFEIITHFGKMILNPDQSINRRLLRKKIFQDTAEKKWLEDLLHPLIRTEMQHQIQQATTPYCIAVIPLLFETKKSLALFDRVLVVDSSEALQQQRLMQRDHINAAMAQAMIAHQVTRQVRLDHADDVIENNDDLTSLKQQVLALHQRYLAIK